MVLFLPFFSNSQFAAGVAGGSIYLYNNGNWVRSTQEGNWSHGDLEATGLRGLALDYGGTCVGTVADMNDFLLVPSFEQNHPRITMN